MVAEDYEGTGNKSGKRESRLMSIQRRLRDQELLYEQLKIEEDLRELDAVRNENSSPSPVKQNDLHDRSIEHKEWENGSKLRGHEGLYGAQLSTTQPPSFNHRRNSTQQRPQSRFLLRQDPDELKRNFLSDI